MGAGSSVPASKSCLRCGRLITWRKKWAKDWENVRYCSRSCRAGSTRADGALDDCVLAFLAAQPRQQVESMTSIDDHVVSAGLTTAASVREKVRRSVRRLSARGLVTMRQGGRVVEGSTTKGDFAVELRREESPDRK
jgi:hypothetical protein